MTVGKKIKTINNKIEKTKAKYGLQRETAKISALSSGNISKFWTGNDFLEKGEAIKKFENSPFGCELGKQTSIAENLY